MAIPVVLDCDPGVDDAAGILLACARPELDVRAITTVGGEHDLRSPTRNALDLLAVAGIRGIPVARVADRASSTFCSARISTARQASAG